MYTYIGEQSLLCLDLRRSTPWIDNMLLETPLLRKLAVPQRSSRGLHLQILSFGVLLHYTDEPKRWCLLSNLHQLLFRSHFTYSRASHLPPFPLLPGECCLVSGGSWGIWSPSPWSSSLYPTSLLWSNL